MHGFALNCDADLSWADNIVACGIEDAGVSSISLEAGRRVGVQDVLPYAEKHLADVLATGRA
jgi:lipoyl(octanoyl) transferase